MNSIIKNLTGMGDMTDQVIAGDFLITAKAGIRNYAAAVTECATPEIKAILRRQLEEAITTHEQITNYMMKRDFYHPYSVNEQLRLDMKHAETALNLP